jgi:carboxyl-terminal processing protease
MQTNSQTFKHFSKSVSVGLLVGLCIGLAFIGGFLFRGMTDLRISVAANDVTSDFGLLREVQSLLNTHYLRPQPPNTELEYGAIRGLLGTLNDRYTYFIDPPVAQSESDVLAGTYGGIGVQIQRTETGALLIFPFRDGPAILAGIQDGDELLEVNNQPVDLTVQADILDQMLRGEVKDGNGVNLTIRRSENENRMTFFVEFAVINIPSVTWRLITETPEIGYVQIQLFTGRTPEELDVAINDLSDQGASQLILDLRNNAGGLLQESVEVASRFLEDGIVLYERTLTGERPMNVVPGETQTQVPLVILVNQQTASAAELVAGALRDRGRAILIGQRTYGKGTVQQIFRLSDSSSLHITSAEWLTPDRIALEGTGLIPDIEMIPDMNGRDVELGEALRYLRNLP